MRHLIEKIAIGALALFTLAACSDSEYSDRYANPAKTSTASCEKLMTGVFVACKTYTTPSYWRYFTFEVEQLDRFAQTLGFTNGKGMYLGMGDNYNNDRWKNFYTTLAQFRILQNTYEKLSETDKPNYSVFVWLANIVIDEQMAEVVDLWGDAPFSKAGYLPVTGDVASSYPSYDDAATIYTTMLNDLKTINSELASYSPSTLTSTYLASEDYINKGDLSKWRRYCNSLRLRLAMRVASNGSLSSIGQAAIKEILSDSSTYPLIDSNTYNVLIAQDADGFNFYDDGINQGFESWNGQVNRASQTYIDAIADGDPRLELIYAPNGEGKFVGMSTKEAESDQTTRFNKGDYYSAVDSGTFSRNYGFPAIFFTAAEVGFLKAEAYQKGYATGDAETAFETAVKQSIDFYYQLNSTATYNTPKTKVSDDVIAAFAKKKWNAYSSKAEAIAMQKWIHFGLIQTLEAWNEIRRTGIPSLYFQTDNATAECPTIPARLKYPTDEKTSNPTNYAAVQSKDSYYTKIFWAK